MWLNRGEDGFETILQLSDSFLGLADGDGDSDVDLLGRESDDDYQWSNMTKWINDGAAGFCPQ